MPFGSPSLRRAHGLMSYADATGLALRRGLYEVFLCPTTEQASDTPEQSRIIVIEAPPKPTEIRWSDMGAPRLPRSAAPARSQICESGLGRLSAQNASN